MEVRKANTKAMYKMNLKLFYRNEAASKTENVLISVEFVFDFTFIYFKKNCA